MNENIMGKVLDLVITILIMLLFPILYFSYQNNKIVETVTQMNTSDFVDNVSEHGELTHAMYQVYLSQLASTNQVFDIEMEHEQLIYEPEYRFKTVDEIKEEQEEAYTGSNEYTYKEVNSERPVVQEEVDEGTVNEETNESVLENSIDTSANPYHVHTDACYNGTKHAHSGSSSSGTGCYTGRYHSGSSVTCGYVPAAGIRYISDITCPVDGQSRVFVHYEGTCEICGVTTSAGVFVYCNTCQFSNDLRGGWHTKSEPGYYDLGCQKAEGKYYDASGREVSPMCNEIIMSILPTHPVQTKYQGEALITTARATYLDGSTKVFICNTEFDTNTLCNSRTVTIYYIGYNSAKTTGRITSNLVVTILPRTRLCSNEHTYRINGDGSDPGCPYCRAWIRTLTIANPTSGRLVITKGTTLKENGVVLHAIYFDGRGEYVSTSYLDNLDLIYVGKQNVTIGYKGKYVSLQVTTNPRQLLCTICENYYVLYPDDTDPGCMYCKALIPVFTGNVLTYYKIYKEDEILEIMEREGVYTFSRGDLLTVKVQSKTSTLGGKLLRMIYRRNLQDDILAVSSNRIRDDKERGR